MPDDPDAAAEVDGTKRRRRRVAPEFGTSARAVGNPTLADRDVVDGLAGPQRNLPVRPGEWSIEVIGDMFGHAERSIRFHDDLDVRLRQAEFLRKGGHGRKGDRASDQNRKEAPPPQSQDRPPD